MSNALLEIINPHFFSFFFFVDQHPSHFSIIYGMPISEEAILFIKIHAK